MSENVKSIPAIPGLHICSAQLYERLKDGKPGDTITDETLRALISKDTRPGGNGYGYLHTALKRCKGIGVIWKRVRGAWALKCLNADETLDVAGNQIKRIHRASNSTVKLMKAVDPALLSDGNKSFYHVRLAQLGTLAMFSKKSTAKKLETRNINKELDLSKMLENMS